MLSTFWPTGLGGRRVGVESGCRIGLGAGREGRSFVEGARILATFDVVCGYRYFGRTSSSRSCRAGVRLWLRRQSRGRRLMDIGDLPPDDDSGPYFLSCREAAGR